MTPKQLAALLDRCRVTAAKGFRLDRHPTSLPDIDADSVQALLDRQLARLSDLQELLYPHGTWALLCVFQAMDAGGKDGTIRQVMAALNPLGAQVTAFKAPTTDELAHDFLWRISRHLPPRGMIGLFNRSQYEEVLVARLHPDILARQKLPARLVRRRFWQHRLEDIAHFEQYLARQGIVQLKFFLHISRDEQKRRLLQRLDNPTKNWKFEASDITERGYWDGYAGAYEDAIRGTAHPHSPWIVVPADHKQLAHLIVVTAMVDALSALGMQPLRAPQEDIARLAAARQALLHED